MQTRASAKAGRRRRATTGEVLSKSLPADHVPPQWQKYYEHLLEMRSFLRRRRRGLVQSASRQRGSRYSQHPADAATQSYEKDLALSRVSSEQDALFEVDAALDRIRNGTYGVCELTGKRIRPERLDAIPWTRFSAQAERQLERQGQVKRARISRPGKIVRAATTNRLGERWEREPRTADKPAGRRRSR